MQAPARHWLCGRFELSLARPLVMGILNVTPDSFSDGGLYEDLHPAIARAEELAAAGADIIDVGGESTRPGAVPVSPEAELDRVLPVVEALTAGLGVPISIDTRHADVAAACVTAGAAIINDVSGFSDPAMVDVAARCDAGLVVMHMLGEPGTMQDSPAYDDVVAEVTAYLAARAAALVDAGVAPGRIALDPGIGFGKTLEHNLELLRGLPALAALGFPVLVGTSRKRFIGDVSGEAEPARRVAGSVASVLWAAHHGADIVRVHDVAETSQALAVWRAIGDERP